MQVFTAPNPVVSIGPTVLPLELADAKRFLRLEHTNDEDADIMALIGVAAEYLQKRTETTLVTTTWVSYMAAFPACDRIALPYGPVTNVAVAYLDGDGVAQLFANVVLVRSGETYSELVLQANASWPATYVDPYAVQITYTAGFGNGANYMPAMVKHAMRLLTRHYYDERRAAAPSGSKALEYSLESLFSMMAPGRVY